MDAVDGPVVLVTEPLHAFEAEKSKRNVLVIAKLRTGHQEGMACGQVCRVRQSLAPTQRSHTGHPGVKEYPTWATRLGQVFQAEVVKVTRLYHVLTGETGGQQCAYQDLCQKRVSQSHS